jgi:hypothetical protein
MLQHFASRTPSETKKGAMNFSMLPWTFHGAEGGI